MTDRGGFSNLMQGGQSGGMAGGLQFPKKYGDNPEITLRYYQFGITSNTPPYFGTLQYNNHTRSNLVEDATHYYMLTMYYPNGGRYAHICALKISKATLLVTTFRWMFRDFGVFIAAQHGISNLTIYNGQLFWMESGYHASGRLFAGVRFYRINTSDMSIVTAEGKYFGGDPEMYGIYALRTLAVGGNIWCFFGPTEVAVIRASDNAVLACKKYWNTTTYTQHAILHSSGYVFALNYYSGGFNGYFEVFKFDPATYSVVAMRRIVHYSAAAFHSASGLVEDGAGNILLTGHTVNSGGVYHACYLLFDKDFNLVASKENQDASGNRFAQLCFVDEKGWIVANIFDGVNYNWVKMNSSLDVTEGLFAMPNGTMTPGDMKFSDNEILISGYSPYFNASWQCFYIMKIKKYNALKKTYRDTADSSKSIESVGTNYPGYANLSPVSFASYGASSATAVANGNNIDNWAETYGMTCYTNQRVFE